VAQGLTLPEVAERAGIDVGHLSRVERGMAGLSIGSLRRLAMVLPLGDLERRLAPFDQPIKSTPESATPAVAGEVAPRDVSNGQSTPTPRRAA
jgi:transcriptional regulator with XRE-family HTH domain